jgi:cytochrome b
MYIKIFSWSQLVIGIAALLLVTWMAISTHGFDAEYDRHGFVIFGAIVFGLCGLVVIIGGLLTRFVRFGPYLGGALLSFAIIFLFKTLGFPS